MILKSLPTTPLGPLPLTLRLHTEDTVTKKVVVPHLLPQAAAVSVTPDSTPADAGATPRETVRELLVAPVRDTARVKRSTLTLQLRLEPRTVQVTGRMGWPTVHTVAVVGEVTLRVGGMKAGCAEAEGVRVAEGVPVRELLGVSVPDTLAEGVVEAEGVEDREAVVEGVTLA